VCKCQNFSATQILREIYLGESENLANATILTPFSGSEIWLWSKW